MLPSADQSSFIGATGVFFLGALLLWLLFKLLSRIKYLNQYFFSRHILLWPSLAAVLLLLILFSFRSYNDLNFSRSSDILPLMQDYLAEAVAAKIMGDSIIVGHPMPGASFAKVKSSAETVAEGLTALSVPSMLTDYKRVAVDWVNEILAAAKNTKTWKDLPSQPADFQLALNNGKAKEWFKSSLQDIYLLKEFGAAAIKNKDREAMRYIAGKLAIEQHWINGILHSKSVFLVSNPIPAALASSGNPFEVPPIGPAGPVPCEQVCIWIVTGNRTMRDKLYLWNMYRCAWCGPVAKRQQQNQQQQNQTGQQQQNQPPAAGSVAGTPSFANFPGAGTETSNIGAGKYEYGPGIRNICLDITGVAGAYCAEAAVVSTWEIAASAIGFAEAEHGAEGAWNGAWHNAEAMGGISEGEPAIGVTEHSPTVQAFYDGCKAKGGIVGGSGKHMARVPTTQGGYKCEYKTDSPSFGTNIPCWDFLTYSGGRYMGGNAGCLEKNLVPIAVTPAPAAPTPAKKTAPAPAEKPTPTPSAPEPTPTPASKIWDGSYSASCTMNCRDESCIFTGYGCVSKSDISQKFDFSIKVQNNAVVSGITAGYILENGSTNNNRIMFKNNGEGYLQYQFSLSGGQAFVSGRLDGGWEEGEAFWVCSCSFSGSRTSN